MTWINRLLTWWHGRERLEATQDLRRTLREVQDTAARSREVTQVCRREDATRPRVAG